MKLLDMDLTRIVPADITYDMDVVILDKYKRACWKVNLKELIDYVKDGKK